MTEVDHHKATAAVRALSGGPVPGASILHDIAREYRALRDRAVWALVGVVGYFLISSATIALTGSRNGHASVWPADAVILALMLSRPRRDWTVLLMAGWGGNLLANGLVRGWTGGIVFYGVVHMGEMLMTAWIVNKSLRGDDLLADGRTTTRFLISAGLIAPGLGAVGGAMVSVLTYGSAFGPSFVGWYGSNALGAVIFTPFFKTMFDGTFVRAIGLETVAERRRGLALFALHVLTTIIVFAQTALPILFLPFSTLMLLSFGRGRLATLAGVIVVEVIGTVASAHMAGPMALTHQGPVFQELFFQFYLAVMMCTALPVVAIVASRAEARELLTEREELLRLVMAHSPDAILGFDGAGVCRWADGPVRDYLGLVPDDLVGLTLATLAHRAGFDLKPVSTSQGHDDAGMRTIEFPSPSQPHITLEASIRSAQRLLARQPTHAVGSVITLRDITLRKARELAMSRRIEIDDLTGVYSRAGFRQRLTRAVETGVVKPGRAVTLALIDVDFFKTINDTHGHSAGDAALVEIARRLMAGTRRDDVVGRMSGDEFAILFQCDIESAQAICERITRMVATEPVAVIGNVRVLTSISCGLAQLRAGMTRDVLFDSADLALYEAKRSGRNGVRAMFRA